MRKDGPLAVDVPSPGKDSPGWVKIGVIAAVGFVIGIAWPRLAGVKLGPTAPGEAAAAAAASASAAKAGRASDAKPDGKADAPPASVKAAKTEPTTSATVAASAASGGGPPQISVLRGNIVSCKTDEGESKKGKECGGVAALDQVVGPRLKKLSTCAAAEGQTGKLSFMVQADFKGGHMTWDVGKSSTVGNHDGISGCLKTIFSGVTLGGVAHEHPRYTVAYNATFSPSEKSEKDKAEAKDDKSSAKAKDEPPKKEDTKKDDDAKDEKPIAAGGEAAVAWEVALVRDTPKTGAVVARLPRGTKVKIGSSKDGWYAVKYGDGFASDGWVYRGAIGR